MPAEEFERNLAQMGTPNLREWWESSRSLSCLLHCTSQGLRLREMPPPPVLLSLHDLGSASFHLPVPVLHCTLWSRGHVSTAPSSLCSCSFGQDNPSSFLCKSSLCFSRASSGLPWTGLAQQPELAQAGACIFFSGPDHLCPVWSLP